MTYIDSAYSVAKVQIDDQHVEVHTIGYIHFHKPVLMWFGPLSLSMSTDKAIEMGTELIRAAHHHRAARAEHMAAVAVGEGVAR